MEGKSYLEILAENDEEARQEFDPNAKDLLVENIHRYQHDVDGDDQYPDELEDQDDFKKIQGSHQQAAGPVAPNAHDDKTKLSVRYDKDVYTRVISIDSRFRTNPSDTSTNFMFKLPFPVKNVISLRVSSIEFPNTFYSFSRNRGNTSFLITYPSVAYGTERNFTPIQQQVLISDGNYDPTGLCAAVKTALKNLVYKDTNGTIYPEDFNVEVSTLTGLVFITNVQLSTDAIPLIIPFDLDFQDGIYSNRIFNYGLGYNLGFRNLTPNSYLNSSSQPTSSNFQYQGIIDVIDSNYVFLTLNPDWKVVTHNTSDRLQLFSFAKICMNVPKFGVVFDNGANTLTKEYWLQQPTNISSIPVRLSDPYDNDLNLVGMDFSFSLEIKEVLNAALYETMRS
jgi:hypothetical protein